MATTSHPHPHVVNVHKRTTQVNLWMVVGVALFFLATAAVVAWHQYHQPKERPVPPEERSSP